MFSAGDKVEFELSPKGSKNRPRWESNIDAGPSGLWIDGIVKESDAHRIVVEYQISGYIGTGVCEWPWILSPIYDANQWDRFGYLRKKRTFNVIKCECGSEKTYGKNVTTHSYWCAKYQKIKKK